MVLFPRIALIAFSLSAAACVPRVDPPTPAPAPRPVPVPAPTPAPAPLPGPYAGDWRDWPVTPGDWRWRPGVATYGLTNAAPLASVTCQARQVTLAFRFAAPVAQVQVQTSSIASMVAVMPLSGQPGMMGFTRAASDRLFDAIGYSRGRFVVTGGGQVLVIPAWPEFLRVVEDCRG